MNSRIQHWIVAALFAATAIASPAWAQTASSSPEEEHAHDHAEHDHAEHEGIATHGHEGHSHGTLNASQFGTDAPEVDPAKLMPPHDYSELEGLVILAGGRKKPLLTFARESLLTLAGRSEFDIAEGVRVEPMPFIVSIWLSGRDWSGQPLILIDNLAVKEALGLPVEGKRFSFREVVGSEQFQPLYQEMEHVRETEGTEGFSELQQAFNTVANRLTTFQQMQSGAAFTLIPHPSDVNGDWVSVPEGSVYYPGEKGAKLNRATVELFAAYHAHLLDDEQPPLEKNFVEASAAFRELQWELSPEVMPAEGKLKAELFYESFNFFRWAWILCLISSIIVALTWSVGRRPGFAIGFTSAAAALLLLTIGMALRVYISGRAPVTNMYETVIWGGFGLIFFSLIFEWKYRCRYYLVSGVSFAAIYLILADSVPAILDPSITPLTAVLRDNFWLTTHVLTVTISYAALGLAFALGHIVLARQIILGSRTEEHKLLYAYIYRAMQVGVLLLTIGVILGGVWANYSWGRFWGWDPKETWALIAILCYLFLMHGRLVGWWKGFGMSVGSVLAFQSVLMAWYGVNFILGAGLHSYGFGTGGTPYVVTFVILELIFVAVALVRRRGANGRGASGADAAAQRTPAKVERAEKAEAVGADS